jgi:outer membrane lipoprotein SlyB
MTISTGENKMKKSLLAVSAVLALGLTACSKEDAAPEAEAAAEATEVAAGAEDAATAEAVEATDAAEPAQSENENPL